MGGKDLKSSCGRRNSNFSTKTWHKTTTYHLLETQIQIRLAAAETRKSPKEKKDDFLAGDVELFYGGYRALLREMQGSFTGDIGPSCGRNCHF